MFKQTNPLYIFISSYANNNNTRELNKKKIPKAHQVKEQKEVEDELKSRMGLVLPMISLVIIFYASPYKNEITEKYIFQKNNITKKQVLLNIYFLIKTIIIYKQYLLWQ